MCQIETPTALHLHPANTAQGKQIDLERVSWFERCVLFIFLKSALKRIAGCITAVP
jgi:hypothetical protein